MKEEKNVCSLGGNLWIVSGKDGIILWSLLAKI